MKILILAAGYGTRLYPLIKDTPKALLPINEKPLMNYTLDKVKGVQGLTELSVITNNKFCAHFEKWADGQKDFSAPILIVNDGTKTPDDRLGSIGDIQFYIEQSTNDDDLLVVGGDNLFDFNIDEYISFAQSKSPFISIGVYDIGNIAEANKFGVVAVDADHKITSFEEKPDNPKSSLIAMCFYYFPRETVSYLKEYLSVSEKTDKAGDYIKWLSEQKGGFAFKFSGKWFDIGSIESYNLAQENFK